MALDMPSHAVPISTCPGSLVKSIAARIVALAPLWIAWTELFDNWISTLVTVQPMLARVDDSRGPRVVAVAQRPLVRSACAALLSRNHTHGCVTAGEHKPVSRGEPAMTSLGSISRRLAHDHHDQGHDL